MGYKVYERMEHLTMTPIVSCVFCKNVKLNKKKQCKAFQNGIPEEILIGENDHTKPYKGDNGIQFEPIEDD